MEYQLKLETYDYILVGISLLATLVYGVWVLIRKKKNIAVLIQLSLLFTLFGSLLCYSLATIPAGKNNIGCQLLAAMYQFLFLSSMFWVNTLAISIIRTLFSLKSVSSASKRIYIFYSVYAFGVPLIITLITYVLSQEQENIDSFTRPVYREKFICFLQESIVIYALFLAPVYLLIAVNVVLCIACMVIVNRSAVMGSNDKARAKKNAVTCIKLCISLGLGWSLLFVYLVVPGIWPVMQVFVELQGLLIVLSYIITWKCVCGIRTSVSEHYSSKEAQSKATELTSIHSTSQLYIHRIK